MFVVERLAENLTSHLINIKLFLKRYCAKYNNYLLMSIGGRISAYMHAENAIVATIARIMLRAQYLMLHEK